MSSNKVITAMLETHRWPAMLTTFVAGSLMTLAYEPVGLSLLMFPLMAVLLYHWLQATPSHAFLHGWLFSLGAKCSGISWIFFSLHYHGGMPAIMAVVMIFLLSAYLSFYFGLMAYVINRFCQASDVVKLFILFPIGWLLAEWLSNVVMTGFAWMQPGYTQIDLPLSGYAPVMGNHFVGALVVCSAALMLLPFKRKVSWQKAGFAVAVIWIAGFGLKQVSWTETAGDDIDVALIQGNVPQEVKWKRHMHRPTLELYRDLTLANKDADLIIWPETAIPDYKHRVPAYIINLREAMIESDTDLLIGMFIKNLDTSRYYNSAVNVRGGDYLKRHLVPLGEFIPLRSLVSFFNRWVKIPMSDIKSGPKQQPLLVLAGQPVSISICFEDAFSRDVRLDLPQATMLVNMSNDAWFDGSHESRQHHAIARMRALETGRYMLRATNTGISSVIGPRGEEIEVAPAQQQHVIRASVTPMQGWTPYVFFGDGLVVAIALVVLLFTAAWSWSRRDVGRE